MDNNVVDLPLTCTDCGRELVAGELFYVHTVYGVICEDCPAFDEGGIQVVVREYEDK